MAATLAVTFTFIRCVRESLYELRYLKSVGSCRCPGNLELRTSQLKNSQNPYGVGLRNMTLQLAMYYVSSHASACYFLIIHGDVIGPL